MHARQPYARVVAYQSAPSETLRIDGEKWDMFYVWVCCGRASVETTQMHLYLWLCFCKHTSRQPTAFMMKEFVIQ